MGGIFNSTIGRKFAMALSAFFLMIFLLQHFLINFTSVFGGDVFNEVSHFMGTYFVVQYIFQPILIAGVIFHFVMGFILEIKNRNARNISYRKNDASENSTWMSRNMIWSGLTILAFLVLHFIDFWIPEIATKYYEGDMTGMMTNGQGYRYIHELREKFENPLRVGAYVVANIFLALHLLHGFSSSFQSIGANNKYTKSLKGFGIGFAILIPLGFIFIALFHHFNHLA